MQIIMVCSWWTWWRAYWRWCRPGCASTASSATSPCPSSPPASRKARGSLAPRCMPFAAPPSVSVAPMHLAERLPQAICPPLLHSGCRRCRDFLSTSQQSNVSRAINTVDYMPNCLYNRQPAGAGAGAHGAPGPQVPRCAHPRGRHPGHPPPGTSLLCPTRVFLRMSNHLQN